MSSFVVSRLFSSSSRYFSKQAPAKFSKKLRRRTYDYLKTTTGADIDAAQFDCVTNTFLDHLKVDDLLKSRYFCESSFDIYGGVAGLYDMDPLGYRLEENLIHAWKLHFVYEENMQEIRSSILTPEKVLKASGHVARFVDWMVTDEVTGECLRADHFIKNQAELRISDEKTIPDDKAKLGELLTKIDGFNKDDLHEVICSFGFTNNGNKVSEPVEFNLMFPTHIGPIGNNMTYLRPELAQGMFTKFKRLYKSAKEKLPFVVAQTGLAFRNEISPRQGLVRNREFMMLEIEHFLDPVDKGHKKFDSVADLEVLLYSACDQKDGKAEKLVKFSDAVSNGTISNQSLAYYLARTYLYLIKVGIDPTRIRFRQHLSNELAHYAQDCWDAEIKLSYGWIECVGHADRSCYDLEQHAKATGQKFVAMKRLDAPSRVTHIVAIPNIEEIAKHFSADDRKVIVTELKKLTSDKCRELKEKFKRDNLFVLKSNGGKSYSLASDMVAFKNKEKTIHVAEVVPHVVEASFGVSRIFYAVLEHGFRQRKNDEKRKYFELEPLVAPYKCAILPLTSKDLFKPLVASIEKDLKYGQHHYLLDDSGASIGKRYAASDEIGIPFAITVDFDSLSTPHTVSLREIASMEQVRVPVSEVESIMTSIVRGRLTWEDLTLKYPLFQASKK